MIEGPTIIVALIDYHKVRYALFKIIIGSSLMFVGNLVGIIRYICKHEKMLVSTVRTKGSRNKQTGMRTHDFHAKA